MMLLVYASRHGAVESCARMVAERLGRECVLIDCERQEIPPLDDYSHIILGFSVHAGSVQKKMIRFMRREITAITDRRPGLFCSCLSKDERAIEYFHKNLPDPIIQASSAIGMFGGAVDFAKMGFFERLIMKRVTKREESFSNISTEAIDTFVAQYNKSAGSTDA